MVGVGCHIVFVYTHMIRAVEVVERAPTVPSPTFWTVTGGYGAGGGGGGGDDPTSRR